MRRAGPVILLLLGSGALVLRTVVPAPNPADSVSTGIGLLWLRLALLYGGAFLGTAGGLWWLIRALDGR